LLANNKITGRRELPRNFDVARANSCKYRLLWYIKSRCVRCDAKYKSMNKKSFIVFALAGLLGGCSCLKREHTPELLVINVLDSDLYNDCHIKGSINVPFEKLEQCAADFDHNVPIVLYCSNYKCTASLFGAQLLKKMGFTHVWAYEAGMAGWYQQGLPIEGPALQPYLKSENKPLATNEDRALIITTEELQQKMAHAHVGTCSSSCPCCQCGK